MAYNKINWENGSVRREGYVTIDGVQYQTVQPEYEGNTPINADNLNHMDNQIKYLSDNEIKKAVFSTSVSPSTSRGSAGYGETSLDISSLNAQEILSVTFAGTSSHMLWGCGTDISSAPTTLAIYGFRITGAYAGNMSVKVIVLYK